MDRGKPEAGSERAFETVRYLFRRTPALLAPPPQPATTWPFASLARSTRAFEKARSAARSLGWDAAAAHLCDAEADPPDPAKFLALKADVFAARRDRVTAETCWQAVIGEFLDMLDAYGARAMAIGAQGRTMEAVEAYLLAMQRVPISLGPPSVLPTCSSICRRAQWRG